MVVRVDPDETQASVLSLPRDLWVPIAAVRAQGPHQQRLPARRAGADRHDRGELRHRDQPLPRDRLRRLRAPGRRGRRHPAVVRRARARHPHRPVDPEHRVPGRSTARTARKFARSRYLQYKGKDGSWHGDPTADFGRITRQQIFIRRAIDKAVAQGLGNPVTLNRLVSAGVDNVRLDENARRRRPARPRASSSSRSTRRSSSATRSPPTSHRTVGGRRRAAAANSEQAEPILNIFRGLPPGSVTPRGGRRRRCSTAARSRARPPTPPAPCARSASPSPTSTTTRSPSAAPPCSTATGGYDAARTVARHITGGAALVEDDDVDDGAVVLVIGKDFTTVHDQLAPEGSNDDLQSTVHHRGHRRRRVVHHGRADHHHDRARATPPASRPPA